MAKIFTFTIQTKGFCDVIDVTFKVQNFVRKSQIKNGLVCVFISGSTAGVTTIEYEPNLVKDFQEAMERLVPQNKKYHHRKTWGDDNGFSHIRASLLGPSLAVPLKDGKLYLGTWQQIVVCDFDNRERQREVIVEIIGD